MLLWLPLLLWLLLLLLLRHPHLGVRDDRLCDDDRAAAGARRHAASDGPRGAVGGRAVGLGGGGDELLVEAELAAAGADALDRLVDQLAVDQRLLER